MKKIALLALAASLSAPVFAAPETFVVNSEYGHTYPNFSWNHLGYSTQLARFDKTTGKIVIDRAAKTGSVDIVIDTTSVNTGSSVFNGHIQADDYLATAQFPTASFKSTAVKFDGDKPVAIEGNLTLKGVTKPVTLKVNAFKLAPHPMVKKDALGADASATVKRTDFNMGKNAPYVSDEVTITIAVEAIKL